MEIGIYTFADVGPGGSHPQRLRQLVEEMELADQVGLDVFGLGEHHRQDFAVSTPDVVLAAIAARQNNLTQSRHSPIVCGRTELAHRRVIGEHGRELRGACGNRRTQCAAGSRATQWSRAGERQIGRFGVVGQGGKRGDIEKLPAHPIGLNGGLNTKHS